MNAMKNTEQTQPALRLASRASPLALAQTEQVRSLLAPETSEIVTLSTTGDEVLDRPLVEVGGKGVFIKTLEKALLDGRADIAVHSAKDMEAEFAHGTRIAAFLPREDMRDALVGSYSSIAELPLNAVIGTASVRRKALLLHLRPDLEIKLLRGNINSRLERLAAGEFDAILLAVAGLKRLHLDVKYTPLAVDEMPPAAAQGALALQMLSDHPDKQRITRLCDGLNCQDTSDCVSAERAALAYLDGSCQTPLSAYARLADEKTLHLQVSVLSIDGRQKFNSSGTAPRAQGAQLGERLAQELLDKCGGRAFLA